MEYSRKYDDYDNGAFDWKVLRYFFPIVVLMIFFKWVHKQIKILVNDYK